MDRKFYIAINSYSSYEETQELNADGAVARFKYFIPLFESKKELQEYYQDRDNQIEVGILMLTSAEDTKNE